MSQTVYNYDPHTRICTGASQADESPLEPGVYLIPAHATTIEPPAVADGKVTRWRADEMWEVIPDVRGTWYDADGQAVQIDDLGADVSALTRTPPPDAACVLVGGQWKRCPDKAKAADAAKRAELCARIDAAVAAIYAGFGRFEAEYTLREQQAKAFKAAGYKGDVPVQVAAFATPAGKTPREAADIIIAQSEQLRGALSQLGVLRMRKYEVMQAADLGKAQAVADEVLAAIAAIGQAL